MSRNKSRTYNYKTIMVDKNGHKNCDRYMRKKMKRIIREIASNVYPKIHSGGKLNIGLTGYCMVDDRPRVLKQSLKWIVKYIDHDNKLQQEHPVVSHKLVMDRVKYLQRCGMKLVAVYSFKPKCTEYDKFFRSSEYIKFAKFMHSLYKGCTTDGFIVIPMGDVKYIVYIDRAFRENIFTNEIHQVDDVAFILLVQRVNGCVDRSDVIR